MGIGTFRGLVVGVALAVTTWAAADEYPSRPIRLIVPFAAGGPTDHLARVYAKALSDDLKHPVVVENRTGAGGNIGADVVAKAPQDGYTVGFLTNGQLTINVSLYAKMPYDPLKDLAPVSMFVTMPRVLSVHPSLGVTTLKELIELAKANPGKYTFASGGNGTTQHLAGELLNAMAGIKLVHIPYKGEGPGLIDVIAGHVPITMASVDTGVPFVKAGKLRFLAVTSSKRSPALPDVPTMAEAGLPGYETQAWTGIFVAAGTPREIIQKLNAATARTLLAPEVAALAASSGGEPGACSPEEFAAMIRAEIPFWAKLIKQVGARID